MSGLITRRLIAWFEGHLAFVTRATVAVIEISTSTPMDTSLQVDAKHSAEQSSQVPQQSGYLLENLFAVAWSPKLCADAVQHTASYLRPKRGCAVHHATVIRDSDVAVVVPAQSQSSRCSVHRR